jgi:NADH-quinone oxidoreductase subunit B
VSSTTVTEEGTFVLTRLDSLVGWCRKNSVWPLPLGLSCCAIEFMATAASRFDLARFGMEVARFSPRQADLLLVAGWLTYKMAQSMTRLYDQMPEPKWVVAMGACASTGGMHRSYSVVQGIDEFLPVDIYIAGCPPRPEAVLNALIHLQDKIGRDRTHRFSTKPPPDAPIARGGLSAVVGRGEMSAPALVTDGDRWTAGMRPAVRDGAVDEDAGAPTSGLDPRAVAWLEAAGARWSRETTGAPAARVSASAWVESVQRLRDDAGFDVLLDLTAVDYPDRDPRFTLVAVLLRSRDARRLTLKTRVAVDEAAPTLTGVHQAADWAERETFDLFGIPFEGHPDLTRIYLPQDYEGWPARRDFPCEGWNRFRD